jgi:hypothetical protein
MNNVWESVRSEVAGLCLFLLHDYEYGLIY